MATTNAMTTSKTTTVTNIVRRFYARKDSWAWEVIKPSGYVVSVGNSLVSAIRTAHATNERYAR